MQELKDFYDNFKNVINKNISKKTNKKNYRKEYLNLIKNPILRQLKKIELY